VKALHDPHLTVDQQQLLRHIQGMRPVVINTKYGGFGLSDEAFKKYRDIKAQQTGEQQHDNELLDLDIARDDPVLVKVVAELGSCANGLFADLKIVEIPADVDWIIEEYDGQEWVAEKHRKWL